MILGLDISTSITGYCILGDDGLIVDQGHIDLRKEKDFFHKVQIAEDRLKEIIEEYKIKNVWIEQSLQAFRPGMSSIKTLLTLSKFNGILSWIAWKETGISPNYIGASTARKTCGITIPRGKKAKEVVVNFLLDTEPAFVVDYTKFGNIKQHYYDVADAIIVAKAGYECRLKKS